MRTPEYLSPSAIGLYLDDKDLYYMRYLSDNRMPRDPQTQPMSVGSGFDAYVKSYLHEALFGKSDEFALEKVLEQQVEAEHRDFASKAGKHIFETYKSTGALADLLLDLEQANGEPRFEFEIKGDVDGVPFLGKPDLYYRNKEGHPVILDWKVNGYCSKYPKSPNKGYIRLRDPLKPDNKAHKDCVPSKYKGMVVNSLMTLDETEVSWARQLSIYAWLLGEDVGADFVCCIDQIVCRPSSARPVLRIAEHRTTVSESFQKLEFVRAKKLWADIKSGHYFSNLTLEESQARCADLDRRSSYGGTEEGQELRAFLRRQNDRY